MSSVVRLDHLRGDDEAVAALGSCDHLQDSRVPNLGEDAPSALVAKTRARGNPVRTYVDWAWGSKPLTRIQLASLIFLVWTAVGAFLAVPEMLRGFYWFVFAAKVIDNWGWALLTPLLLLIDRKLALRQRNLARVMLLFLLLSVPVTLVHTYLVALLLYPIPQVWWSPLRNSDYTVFYFLGGWATYCALVGILLAVRFYNGFLTGQLQLERVEKNLLESRMHALRLHLEPHFLFNTLNAISSELGANPELARNMIGDLGALLRRSLDCQDRAEITLAQELALLEHYLSIQRVRFGDRLEIKIDVSSDVLSVMVPSMLLQPLVENAIRHGIEGRISGGRIVVSGLRVGDQLQLRVVDNGGGLSRDWRMETSTGHGLRVTLERLRALYPGAADERLTIRRCRGGGTEVAIRIPLDGTGRHGAIA
ncbi:MAG: sensor histidine kinase [Rhizomicrobium sp.]|jgi:two-component system LytT family sensor kinase